MTNGWLIAAAADAETGAVLAEGFELDLMRPSGDQGRGGQVMQLAEAPNVGIVLSMAAAQDQDFVALLRALASRRNGAQLIIADDQARARFPFLPQSWPTMPLEEALRRARLAEERRSAPHAAPLPPATEAPRQHAEPAPEEAERGITLDEGVSSADAGDQTLADAAPSGGVPANEQDYESFGAEAGATEHASADRDGGGVAAPLPPAKSAAPPPMDIPPPGAARAPAPAVEPPPYDPPTPQAKRAEMRERAGVTLSADATAFAPRKLRRDEAELVRIVIHQPKDLGEVIRAARKSDPRTTPAPQGMHVGDVSLGARIGVSLDVRGAACDGALQRRAWLGDPLDFVFAVEAEGDAKQVVILARVFVEDAQIGLIGFTRQVMGPRPNPLPAGERARLKRHKRVFLSYSSRDRETVATIATAYESAGVEHFWDRTALRSGEEWSPRLRREIERCDLFHLCWSRSAAESEWVEKEAGHAIGLRRRKKKPDITVQMLDGPPWAPHPESLDSINFDDFVRAAIVGYARGEG